MGGESEGIAAAGMKLAPFANPKNVTVRQDAMRQRDEAGSGLLGATSWGCDSVSIWAVSCSQGHCL